MRGAITGTFGMTMHVNDLAKTSKFWESLGLRSIYATDEAAGFAVPNSGPISLHKWQSACQQNGGRPPGTVSGIMLSVDDAKAVADRVTSAGGRVVAPPFPAPSGQGHWAILADPDGNECMVCAPS